MSEAPKKARRTHSMMRSHLAGWHILIISFVGVAISGLYVAHLLKAEHVHYYDQAATFFFFLIALLVPVLSHFLYVRPAAKLVRRIAQRASGNSADGPPRMLLGWRRWFGVVDETFDRIDRLMADAHESNRQLEVRVAERTEELRRQLRLGRTLTIISSGLIGTDRLDNEINNALRTIGEFVGADRAYLFLVRPNTLLIDNTHEWCREGATPEIENLKGINPQEELPWFWEQIKTGESMNIPSVAKLPEEAASEKEHWQAQNIESLLVVPMMGPGGLTGFVGFDFVGRSVGLSNEEINLLRMTGEAIDRAMSAKRAEDARKEAESQLHEIQRLESVGTLAGGMAHEFNNQLMGMMGYAELCMDNLDKNHPAREWLDEISAGARRSAKLVGQLLAFARKQTIVPEVIDLNDVVTRMLNMLRRLIGEDIQLVWRPCIDVWPVKCDPLQINQILTNMLTNARDAIGGVGSINISTNNVKLSAGHGVGHIDVESGDYVELAIHDTGCGIEEEALEHIFDPFYTTKQVGKGSGLGLSTVHGIVSQNAGCIDVDSDSESGTTFRICLPRYIGEGRSKADHRTATGSLPKGDETILLVEDEKSIRLTTKMFLEDLGYTVHSAETPEIALKLFSEKSDPFHMLITDVVMPGMSGPDLAACLAEKDQSIKVLYMSGYSSDNIANRGVLDIDTNFLSKPCSRHDLANKVREILS